MFCRKQKLCLAYLVHSTQFNLLGHYLIGGKDSGGIKTGYLTAG